MKFAQTYAKTLIDGYRNGKSMQQLADELGTNPMRISRALKHLGIKSRDQSEAMKLALDSGRATHPTEGKTHSEDTKLKISESRAEAWDNLTEEELERIKEDKRDQWNSMSDEQKAEIKKKAHKAILESAKKGSKVENILHEELLRHNYKCLMHCRPLENNKLEVDLLISNESIVIEVDGPSHYSNIWSDEALKKTQSADKQKNGLLLQHGFTVIRLETQSKTLSQRYKRDIINAVLNTINDIKAGKRNQIIKVRV